jgi:hypothetical protein
MDAEKLNAVIIIGAIIQVALIIMFIVLVQSVVQIKNHLLRMANKTYAEYMSMADIEQYIGNTEKRKEYLLRAKYILEKSIEQAPQKEYSDYLQLADIELRVGNSEKYKECLLAAKDLREKWLAQIKVEGYDKAYIQSVEISISEIEQKLLDA